MRVLVFLAALAALGAPARAADDVNADEIIKKFAAKELEFQQARNNYTYRQSVKLEELEAKHHLTDQEQAELNKSAASVRELVTILGV